MLKVLIASTAIVTLTLSTIAPSQAAFAGINELIKVTQLGAQNANNQAMDGATKQRELIKKQQELRNTQVNVDSLTGGSTPVCTICFVYY